jgi:hypothetical protein
MLSLLARAVLVVFVGAVLSGCVTSERAALETPDAREALNARLDGRDVRLSVEGERTRTVRALRLSADGATWLDHRTGEARSAPLERIAAITFRDDLAGGLKGAALGAAVGAAASFLVNPSNSRTVCTERLCTGQGVGWTLNAGLFGAGAGALVGLAVSDRHVVRPERRAEMAGVAGLDPALVGSFADDYGNTYEITPQRWVQQPHGVFHLVEADPAGRSILARNDTANTHAPGLWTRIDWVPLNGMAPYTWAFCLSAYDAPSEAAARSAPVADRAAPRTGCNGYPFSRMRRR